jgi:hypothetical protein
MRSVLVATAAAVLLLGACGEESESDESGPEPPAREATEEEPSEVRLKVLPEPDYGEEGPLSFMEQTEIIKCWEDGEDLLAQVYFEQPPPTSVRVVLAFVTRDGSEETKAIDLEKTETVTLSDAAGEFTRCRLDAAVLEG